MEDEPKVLPLTVKKEARIKLGMKDASLLHGLREELQKSGAISRPEPMKGQWALSPAEELMEEAVRGARSEKELNPSHYDPKTEAHLLELARSQEDWENPSLDGVDDYGRQVYPNREDF